MARRAQQSRQPVGSDPIAGGRAEDRSDANASAEAESIASLSYEQALEELESLVRRVEDGALTLEEGIAAHRRAVLLLRHCERILDRAQTQIEEISGRDLAAPAEE